MRNTNTIMSSWSGLALTDSISDAIPWAVSGPCGFSSVVRIHSLIDARIATRHSRPCT
jgi:hypothetical protein